MCLMNTAKYTLWTINKQKEPCREKNCMNNQRTSLKRDQSLTEGMAVIHGLISKRYSAGDAKYSFALACCTPHGSDTSHYDKYKSSFVLES